MEKNSAEYGSASLAGMNAAAAKEYILGVIAALKLTEKEILSLEGEAAKWKDRAALARSRGADELSAAAEKEAEKINVRLAGLREEERLFRKNISVMRKQLPGLAARKRSVDPDLLEQELLIAAGRMPGDEEKARAERSLGAMEKEEAAAAALEELKAKMKITPS